MIEGVGKDELMVKLENLERVNEKGRNKRGLIECKRSHLILIN